LVGTTILGTPAATPQAGKTNPDEKKPRCRGF